MKIVYFVRHGESLANVARTVQGVGLEEELTERGQKQARVVAERAAHIDFDALLASDLVRAHQTAEHIADITGKEIEFSELFREVQWPSSIVGKPRDGEESVKFLEEERNNITRPEWRYEDAENFADIKERASGALTLLESHASDTILVVTHGHFLRFVVSMMLMDTKLTPEIWLHLRHALLTVNTGVTVCRLNEAGRWSLLTWNDHAHFAE